METSQAHGVQNQRPMKDFTGMELDRYFNNIRVRSSYPVGRATVRFCTKLFPEGGVNKASSRRWSDMELVAGGRFFD
jgi:hypothetical protein